MRLQWTDLELTLLCDYLTEWYAEEGKSCSPRFHDGVGLANEQKVNMISDVVGQDEG